MKKILKKLFNSTLILCQSLISVISVLIFSSFNLSRKNKKQSFNDNQECFILGNGPSLKQELTENFNFFLARNKNILCVNLLCEDPVFYELKPSYYIITDEGFWNETNDERILNIQKQFVLKMQSVNWDFTLFIPNDGKTYFENKLNNKFVKICYYNRTPVNGFKCIRHFLYRKDLGMPAPHNVLIAAIFVFINMGYKNINVYGADHSWVADLYVDENNDLWSYQNHFYDDKKVAFKLKKGSLYTGLQGIVKAFESYQLLREYSESIGAKIINRTKKSFLDIFEYK